MFQQSDLFKDIVHDWQLVTWSLMLIFDFNTDKAVKHLSVYVWFKAVIRHLINRSFICSKWITRHEALLICYGIIFCVRGFVIVSISRLCTYLNQTIGFFLNRTPKSKQINSVNAISSFDFLLAFMLTLPSRLLLPILKRKPLLCSMKNLTYEVLYYIITYVEMVFMWHFV